MSAGFPVSAHLSSGDVTPSTLSKRQVFNKPSRRPWSNCSERPENFRKKASARGCKTFRSKNAIAASTASAISDGGEPPNTTSDKIRAVTIARVSSMKLEDMLCWQKLAEVWNDRRMCTQTVLSAVSTRLLKEGVREDVLKKSFYASCMNLRSDLSERILETLLYNVLQNRPYAMDCAWAQATSEHKYVLARLWNRLKYLYIGHHADLCWHLENTCCETLLLGGTAIQEYRAIRASLKLPAPRTVKEHVVPTVPLRFLSATCKPEAQVHSVLKTSYCKVVAKNSEFKSPRYESVCERLLLMSQLREGCALLELNPHQLWIFQTIIL
ncbi:ORF74 [Ranid herpesvirus 2]|uniref:ORF74 n=1 Tax=Ranid herpesvirus 2 TaxID=389214 RepID=Q14W32_9VIRU|nr:ORF74 [Ranid herpesvirus 2]ABG25636.1 ORF74 [Ranid herpesvirus 2]